MAARAAPPASFRKNCRLEWLISSHLENQLAFDVTRLARSRGFDGIGQLIERDLGPPDDAGLVERGNAIEMPPVAAGVRPQRRHVAARGHRRLLAGRDEGRAAAGLEHREGARRDLAT